MTTDKEIAQRVADRMSLAEEKLASLPGWATWSPELAADWALTNAKDIETMRRMLAEMAFVIVSLRDIVRPLIIETAKPEETKEG